MTHWDPQMELVTPQESPVQYLWASLCAVSIGFCHNSPSSLLYKIILGLFNVY